MSIREIVTFQVGHYANYVGTHWWNLQEASFSYDPKRPSEVNNDAMFREGYTPRGNSTYLPRLISVDLKDSLGCLKQDGMLYGSPTTSDQQQLWTSSVDIQKSEPFPKNEYLQYLEKHDENYLQGDKDEVPWQGSPKPSVVPDVNHFNLDDSVKVWSDYLCTHLHPNSIHLIKEYSHNNEVETFDVFCTGQKVMASEENMDAVEEKIHFFVEGCDNLQGFHVLADGNNGFVGAATTIASYLKDEFSNKILMTVPFYDASTVSQKSIRHSALINSFFGLKELSSLSDFILPMSCFTSLEYFPNPVRTFPFLNFKSDCPYHTSAMLASALDTTSAAYRLRDGHRDMVDLITSFNICGRKIAAMSTVFPLPLWENVSIVETLLKRRPDIVPRLLMPSSTYDLAKCFNQLFVIRGLPLNMKINVSAVTQQIVGNELISSFDELLRWYLTDVSSSAVTLLQRIGQHLNVNDPFPHIFIDKISANGLICSEPRASNTGVCNVPLISGLHSGSSVRDMLSSLVRTVGKINIRKLHPFIEAGLETDEVLGAIEELKELGTCYE